MLGRDDVFRAGDARRRQRSAGMARKPSGWGIRAHADRIEWRGGCSAVQFQRRRGFGEREFPINSSEELLMRRMVQMYLAVAVSALAQTTINGGRVVSGTWDASNAVSSKPAKTGSSLPATCGVGEQFFLTTAPA